MQQKHKSDKKLKEPKSEHTNVGDTGVTDRDLREKEDYIHRQTNEGIRNRWREAGEGQVREGNGKTLGGTGKQDVTHEGTMSK